MSNRKPIQQCGRSGGCEDPASRQRPSSPANIRPVSAMLLDHIKPNPRNPRTHSKKQIRQIADCIQAIGFAAPVLIDETGVLLAGHGRLEAAKLLGLEKIPAVVIEGLSEARKRALLLADNRIAQSAGWDRERLADELTSLPEFLAADGLDISVTGKSTPYRKACNVPSYRGPWVPSKVGGHANLLGDDLNFKKICRIGSVGGRRAP